MNSENSAFAIFAASNGTGSAGYLQMSGTGDGLTVVHRGNAGNLVVFKNGNNQENVARIDKTGKAFFNGGTVSSGADVAEAFDVEGDYREYEPGDVW